jgi:hypothetical protein
MGESALKAYARELQANPQVWASPYWNISIYAEGRTVRFTYSYKQPIKAGEFLKLMPPFQNQLLDGYCSKELATVVRLAKATETHTFYNANGEWLMSFSIGPEDCPQP